MKSKIDGCVDKARQAALNVLLHNARSGRSGLPRTAAWGYPEPYTRDLMISSFGILSSGDEELIDFLRRTLTALSISQSPLGLISGLADDSGDLGASDTTPLFLIGIAAYRKAVEDSAFLEESVLKAVRWMEHQSPTNAVIVAQQPTSDWRDEQWVLGYGLYVNALVYSYLRLLGHDERATRLKTDINKPVHIDDFTPSHKHEGLVLEHKPHYALWSYKLYHSERFDLLGNSLAILSGIAKRKKADSIIDWIESSCQTLRNEGNLAVDLPPNFFPYIKPSDPDWKSRYKKFNNPGEYHNGGIWPFVCGFYIAALVAIGKQSLAEQKLAVLTELVRCSRNPDLDFGFNEWIRAQDGLPCGQDWQTWSAAMYLYAVECVETGKTSLFDTVRAKHW